MKRLTATALAVLVLVASIPTGCTRGHKKVRLRYKFEPGIQLVYEQLTKGSTRVMKADSVVRERSVSYQVRVEQQVRNVFQDKTAEIVELATWTHETWNKEDTTRLDTVQRSRELVFRVQPDGKILDVRFPEDEDYTSVQYIKNYYEQGMPVFPGRELAPGDSWTQTTKVVLPGEPMEASVSYKVTALVREAGYDCAVIECDGQMFIPIEPNPKDTVQRTGLDNIKSTGKLYFAYKEGMVVLQRERWVIDRHRKLISRDKTEEFREAVELDVDFVLKSRMAVDSLAI